jgi:hypothetical protein
MSKLIRTLAPAALAAGSLLSVPAAMAEAEAQKPKMVDMTSYTCKDIVRFSGEERTVALAVLHGYALGKKGVTTFDADKLGDATTDFIEHCLDNPSDKALEAFAKFAK